jgi:type IV fimbrial biogenesis protein FimT
VVLIKTGANWEDGWQVFVDMAADNAYNPPADFLIRDYSALETGYTLRANNSPVFVRFTSAGLSSFSGSFVFCDNRDSNNIPEANTARVVIMTGTGKVRLGADDDHDGIPAKDKNGNELTSCVPPF